MTTPDGPRQPNMPRAPQAPGDLGDTAPYPAIRPEFIQQVGGQPSDSQSAADTQIHLAAADAGAQANRAQAAANRADAAAARSRFWPVQVIRENRRNSLIAGGAAALGVLALCTCGLCAVLNGEKLTALIGQQPYGTTAPEGQYPTAGTGFSGPAFACSPAVDKGGFPSGVTVDTRGKGGAVVDDTLPGQQTQVAVIPAGKKVHLKGAVHEWVYNSDCTPSQIQQQAQQHATAAGDVYVSDYQSLEGFGSTGGSTAQGIPTTDLRANANYQERVAQRQAARKRAALPLWRRVFTT